MLIAPIKTGFIVWTVRLIQNVGCQQRTFRYEFEWVLVKTRNARKCKGSESAMRIEKKNEWPNQRTNDQISLSLWIQRKGRTTLNKGLTDRQTPPPRSSIMAFGLGVETSRSKTLFMTRYFSHKICIFSIDERTKSNLHAFQLEREKVAVNLI